MKPASTSCTILSVRSSEAPAGSWIAAITLPWSCAGMNPVGVRKSTNTVSASKSANTRNTGPGRRTNRVVMREYQRLSAANAAVKRSPKLESAPRQPRPWAWAAPCGRSTSTQTAGESVSETVSEITTVAVMVSANCL